MFLSILSGSRSMGGGDIWEECREQGPLSPSRFAFSSLLCLSFCVEIRCHCSCVCASCSNPKVGEKGGLFVLMTVSRPLWVEMFNHSPVAVSSCSRRTLVVIIKNRKETYFLAQITLLQYTVSGERMIEVTL